jgi:hypothetical protein
MASPHELFAYLLYLGTHPLGNRLSHYRESFVFPSPRTNMRESQKLKGLRLAFPSFHSVCLGEPAKLYEARLFCVEL